mmetsp:Transcript_31419/g.54223  ORF Transcript_31419/g.54223 Transcript_31419/m.54223 type:complete len:92 (-) Transcript_31419:588-863(-)
MIQNSFSFHTTRRSIYRFTTFLPPEAFEFGAWKFFQCSDLEFALICPSALSVKKALHQQWMIVKFLGPLPVALDHGSNCSLVTEHANGKQS